MLLLIFTKFQLYLYWIWTKNHCYNKISQKGCKCYEWSTNISSTGLTIYHFVNHSPVSEIPKNNIIFKHRWSLCIKFFLCLVCFDTTWTGLQFFILQCCSVNLLQMTGLFVIWTSGWLSYTSPISMSINYN